MAQGGEFLTTAEGVRIPDTDHSFKAGERGPSLLDELGAEVVVIAAVGGELRNTAGSETVDRTLLTARSIEFDALVVADGVTPTDDIKLVVFGTAVAKNFNDELVAAVGLHRSWARAEPVMASV